MTLLKKRKDREQDPQVRRVIKQLSDRKVGFHFKMSEDLHARLKIKAIESRKSIQEILEILIERYVSR